MLTAIKCVSLCLVVFTIVLLVSLSPPWIEWDEYDNSIHGKTVKFTKTMSYVPLVKEHLKHGFSEEEIQYERILLLHDSYAYNEFLYSVRKNNSKILPIDKEFVIERSYWRKNNWLVHAFNSNLRYAVLKDSDGIYSIISFFDFSDSTEKKLSDINFIYGEQ